MAAAAVLAAAVLCGGGACRGRQSASPAQPDQPEQDEPAAPTVARQDPPAKDPAKDGTRPFRAAPPRTRTQSATRPVAGSPAHVPDPGLPKAVIPALPPADPAIQNWTPPATSQPATAPAELADLPPPAVGQFVVYTTSAGGPNARLRQTVGSLGPGPGEVIVGEQLLINNQPVGKPRQIRLPRLGRIWPAPTDSDARTVAYTRERIELAGRSLDCLVLTIEARAAGSLRVEKQWISREVPITHVARSTLSIDGREVMRQEAVDFGEK